MPIMSKNAQFKLQIILLPFNESKRQRGSKTVTVYNTKPFNLERVTETILKALEGCEEC